MSAPAPLLEQARTRGFRWMLLLLVVHAVLAAYGEAAELERVPLMNAILGVALVLGVTASEVSRPARLASVVLVVLGLLWQMVENRTGQGPTGIGHQIPIVALVIYTLVVAFSHVFRAERITSDKVAGAICVYALLAALWGIVYTVLGADAFIFSRAIERPDTELFYYSWVTLTTLGYGDITPVHPLARVAANIECFVGQFYIAIVVARMVALQLIQTRDPSRTA